MNLVLVFFTLFIWSSSFTLSKQALGVASPLFITGFRMIVAGLMLTLIGLCFRKRVFSGVNRKSFFNIILLSLTGFYLANVFEFYALTGISSSKASFIYGLSPFITAGMSYIHLKERISSKKCLGLFIGIIGYVAYLWFSSSEIKALQSFVSIRSIPALPELLLIVATGVACFGWSLMRKVENQYHISPFGLNAVAMLLSGVLTLIHSFIVEPWHPVPVADIPVFLKSVAALVVISNIICYNLYGYLLKKFSATFLSFCGLVMPLFAAFFGWLLLNETISVNLLWGVGTMLIGCRIVYAEELRLGYILKEKPNLHRAGAIL